MNKKSQEKKKSSRSVQEEFLVLLEEGLRTAGRVTKREFDRVSDTVRSQLEKKYGKEKVEQFHAKVRSNWQETADKFNSAKDKLGAEESFRRGREVGAQILTGLADAIRKAAENLESGLSDKISYHAGQVVDKGIFLCNSCRKIQEVKRKRKLSICSECGSTEFRMA